MAVTDKQETKEFQENLANLDPQAHQALKAPQDVMEAVETVESEDHKENVAQQENQDKQEHKVLLGQKGHEVRLESTDSLDLQDLLDHQDLLERATHLQHTLCQHHQHTRSTVEEHTTPVKEMKPRRQPRLEIDTRMYPRCPEVVILFVCGRLLVLMKQEMHSISTHICQVGSLAPILLAAVRTCS